MMDTVLNLGLNDEVVEGLAKKRGERFAFDCYRRLLDMFGDVVLGIEHSLFEAEIHAVKVGGWVGGGWGACPHASSTQLAPAAAGAGPGAGVASARWAPSPRTWPPPSQPSPGQAPPSSIPRLASPRLALPPLPLPPQPAPWPLPWRRSRAA